ncbi:hypothetical protein SAMN05421856_1212 [Chryseobacterium taichungense]|uniref:Uncharacterized protein n=1 Tax=Chryseobacterium taichungense TaxID=295069 RepID=A0A1H8DXC3_9FLAO|nr:hypothetical protein [Chryseobacterium taichungense]SEN11840.1 hypothetical protein SAMN05421856_1212 [Chryseobacterium taichungense]
MLYSNNIKAQEHEAKILKKINSYFDQLKKEGLQGCIDSDLELYEAAKKDKHRLDVLMMGCNDQVSHYDLYKTDTKKLLSNFYKDEDSDFIIVNMKGFKNNPILYTKPTLTFSRKKNEKKINIIHNYYQFDENKNGYELVKDSSISNFNVEEKMKLIEDYLYYKKENSISEVSRGQPYREYYIVARINGKYLIKALRDYNLKD